MRTGGAHFVVLIIFTVIPRLAAPVDGAVFGCGRIVVQTFPPNRVETGIVADICEDGIAFGGSQRVGVGFFIGTGRHAEEAVLGVDRVKLAVFLIDAQPRNVVADRPDLVALLLEDFRRNQHGQVGLAAGRGESGGDILDIAIRILQSEDEHMLSHPALFTAQVRGNAERKALFAKEHISAVAGVDRHDGIVLREVCDITVFFVQVSLRVQALDEVRAVAQRVHDFLAGAGHD